jgi:hypothetical protein
MGSTSSAATHIDEQGLGRAAPGRLTAAVTLHPERTARVVLAALLVGTGVFLFHITQGTTFWFDEWIWIAGRRSNTAATFLDPHNGHLSLIPLVIYRTLFATVGLDDYAPYRVLVIVGHLTCVVLVFLYAERRVGSFAALLASALVLFLGPAWQNIIWPFQIAWLLSVAGGVAALMMLDRRTMRGDVAATALLAFSIASTGLGLCVAIGVAVEVLWARRRPRDAWIFLVPLALYGLWWLRYGDTQWIDGARAAGVAHPVVDGILSAPAYAAGSAAATLSGLAGLGHAGLDPSGNGTFMTFGPPLAVLGLLALVWRLRAWDTFPPRALGLLVIAASFWVFTAITRGFIQGPTTSRYLYVGGVFLVLAAAELGRGRSLRGWPLVVVAVAVGAAALSNIGAYRNAAAYLRNQAQMTRADLGVLAIGGPLVPPGFRLEALLGQQAGQVRAAEVAWGSPAASPAEIAAAPPNARKLADVELVRIHNTMLRPGRGGPPGRSAPRAEKLTAVTAAPRGSCLVLRPAAISGGGRRAVALTLPRGGVAIVAQGGSVDVGLRRFADEAQDLGRVSPGASATLQVGPDSAPQPWHLDLTLAAGATVCGQR